MVVTIEKTARSAYPSFRYSEQKVADGQASVIFSHNIDNPSNPWGTFARFENGSIKGDLFGLHITVNPSQEDNMTDEEITGFVQEYMEKLGYGQQPYLLYRHEDTGRVHYHIVSTRVAQNGYKIKDRQEYKRSQKAMRELSSKYHFTIGRKNSKKQVATNPHQGFDKSKGDSLAQIENITKLAMTYHFKRGKEYIQLMHFYGVGVKTIKKGFSYYGLDKNTGKRCTDYFTSKNFPTMHEIVRHIENCRKDEVNKLKEKERVHHLTNFALDKAVSEKHFRNILHKKGISVKFKMAMDGKLVEATFIDTQSKSLFSIKDMKGNFSDLTLDKIAAARQQWPDRYEPQWENLHKETTRKTLKAINALYSAVLSGKSRAHEDEEILRQGEHER